MIFSRSPALVACGPWVDCLRHQTSLSYLWSALWLGSIRRREERPPKPAATRNMHREIIEGSRAVFADPILRAIGLLCTRVQCWWFELRPRTNQMASTGTSPLFVSRCGVEESKEIDSPALT